MRLSGGGDWIVCDQRSFFGLQKAGQLGGVSLLALIAVGPLPTAEAQERFFFHEPPVQRFQGPPDRSEARRPPEPRGRIVPRQSGRPAAKQAIREPEKVKEAPPPPGPHMLIVSVR
jgi:hypothetical protein